VKDLNAIYESLKLQQENIGKTLEGIEIGNDFLKWTPIAREIRARIEKLDCIIFKSFCKTRSRIKR
jgi:hypothetical protein